MAHPYEYFYSINDYKKPNDNLKEEDFFSKLKNECPSVDEIQRTKKNIKTFDVKNGKEVTKSNLKSDVISLADVFEKIIKVSFEEY